VSLAACKALEFPALTKTGKYRITSDDTDDNDDDLQFEFANPLFTPIALP